MNKRKDISGEKIGNIDVVSFSHVDNRGNSVWNCKCACGREYKVYYSNLKRSAGVGCVECKNVNQRKLKTQHGMTDSRIHTIWMHMIDRCEKQFNRDYLHYGGRGISVCNEWRNNFMTFYQWSTENGYSNNLTIDRINVNGNYEPQNCRWVCRKIQNNNRRDNNRYVIDGISHTLSEWCDLYNIEYSTVKGRLKIGIDIKTAISTKKQKPFGFKKLKQ